MTERIKLREEILEQLSSFGISGKDVYFIDYIPLIEMIWADGQPQQGEKDIFTEYPYGLHERFNADEKRCFFEILDTFENKTVADTSTG